MGYNPTEIVWWRFRFFAIKVLMIFQWLSGITGSSSKKIFNERTIKRRTGHYPGSP